ncbi:SDR family NAD(P)-dependent oxidoreductase [Phenylobacterium sp. LjRoot225]|uniref:SDR family NAD(P)-dependent oxidoreductase n=1 Tax=Phenylobacterium sp. LjRoot225 TaxID=3342285 RepID=UPI003ECFB833
MRPRLEGRVVLVAGAGGIGSALALRYAAEGAKVALGDLKLESAAEVVEAIRKAGGEALALHLDGADEASVTDAVASCVSTYGGLDGLHANFANLADSSPDLSILDLPLAVYDDVQRVNARGFYLCTRAAIPELLKRGGGAIVYTSSAAAYSSGPAQVAYAMSKAAGHALMRHVALRFGAQGIRANALAPALTLHPSIEALLPPQMIDWAKAAAAIKSRVGRPEDIAAMGALLMSDEGSYITGQVISIDGGTIMRS